MLVAIGYLATEGHTLRRPHADFLEEGIYELRVRKGTVNYRILYFSHGQGDVVLAHCVSKEDVVPPKEIARAKERRELYLSDPDRHSEVL